jgi:hypothetical protein
MLKFGSLDHSKVKNICRPAWIALLCGLALVPVWARADEISDMFQKLQQNPSDLTLNLRYAAAAEKGGKLKWALPAYERALMADPRNVEARAGVDRVTREIRAEAAKQ